MNLGFVPIKDQGGWAEHGLEPYRVFHISNFPLHVILKGHHFLPTLCPPCSYLALSNTGCIFQWLPSVLQLYPTNY